MLGHWPTHSLAQGTIPAPATAAPAHQASASPLTQKRSAFEAMSPALQAMQTDDAQNPAFLWVQGARASFEAQCSRCHSPQSLQDVATRYPAFDAILRRPLTVAGRINQCRRRHLNQPALGPEDDELLGLQTLLGLAARGQPMQSVADPRLQPWLARGQALWQQRHGQIDLSCAECHDRHAGGRLAGSPIPQGHATGYPTYRLEWQTLGSLQRRFRNCMTGVRAEPYAQHSDEFTALELYLRQRAAGMAVETPAVRP